MPSVASEPSIISHQHHNVSPRGRAAGAEANDAASPFALLVEGTEAAPPAPKDRGERTPASRTAPAESKRADAQTSGEAEGPTADAPAADAKAVGQASGDGAAADGDEGKTDELEAAVAIAAVGDADAAPATPDPQAVPVAVATALVQQPGGTVDGGDGTMAATGTTAPEIPIAGPQGGEPSKGGTEETAAANTGPAGAQPPHPEEQAAEGKGAAAEHGNDHTPPGPQPVGERAAELEGAARAALGKPQAKAESQPAKADQPATDEAVTDEADGGAAARSGSASPESGLADNPAPARHRAQHHADPQKADDATRQPPGMQVSETAHGAKPPSEALLAILPASDAAQGATAQAAPAAAQAASEEAVPIAGLAVEIAARAQAGRSRFEIRLDPPELGRIDVRLDVDRNGQVTSRLVVERAETLEYLRRDAAEIERALQQAGLKTTDNGLQFTLRDQGFAGRDDHAPPHSARVIVPDSSTATADVPGAYSPVWRAGGIDIRV